MASRYLCPVFLAIAFWLPSAQAAVVPNTVGQTQAAATTALTNAGLTVGTVTYQTGACPAGTVMRQSPAAGVSAANGSLVDLVVCLGPAGSQNAVRISIKNDYALDLNFGLLGKGSRNGLDEAEGVLVKRGNEYFGTVTARVDSSQTLQGLIGACGPGHYQDSQQLDVIGHPVDSLNARSQTATINSGAPGNEFLALEFKPRSRTSQQPLGQNDADIVIACHTLIDTPSGISFLPLNDARWTMPGGGYIIALPDRGVLEYTDNTVPGASGTAASPIFNVRRSLWTIRVERL